MGLLAKPQGREHLVMTKVSLAVSQKKRKQGRGVSLLAFLSTGHNHHRYYQYPHER